MELVTDAGNSVTVILHDKPPGTNVYARFVANVVKVRPFRNMLHMAKNRIGILIYDALRNKVLSDPVAVEPASVLNRGQWKPGGTCAVVGGNKP